MDSEVEDFMDRHMDHMAAVNRVLDDLHMTFEFARLERKQAFYALVQARLADEKACAALAFYAAQKLC